MRTTTLLLLSLVTCAAQAQPTPNSLRPDITVEHYMNVRSNAVRLSMDPVSQQMHYLRTNGDVLVVIDDGLTAPYDSVLFTAADHALDQAFGMAFHDSDLYVIGNAITGNIAMGILHRARLRPDGSRIWSVAAQTSQYAWGGKGHGFNNVVVSPDGTELYLNCGSRTDHGEVQNVDGAFPNLREEPITAKILRIPTDANDLMLFNNDLALADAGRVFSYGLRNTFDMAFDAEGRLFGVENSGDHDDPEEMNWLRQGRHYGFPWTAGGNMNPTPMVGYDPVTDPLLNPGYPAAATDFYYDASFPAGPSFYTEPMLNTGPDADRLRDPFSGGMRDASDESLLMHTFTCHRSPLGLVFDNANILDADLRGDAFMLSFTPGGDTLGFSPIAPWGIPVVPADPSGDLLHLKLEYDGASDNFTVQATRIVEGFYLAVDAELVGNELYVIENSGGSERSIWKVTLPMATGMSESCVSPTNALSIWPVPCSDHVAWSTGSDTPTWITLIDMQGRIIRSERPSATSGQLNVQAVPSGTYILRAQFANSSTHRRFSVVK